MSDIILSEALIFLHSFLLGVCITVVYDVFISLRKAFRHIRILIFIENSIFLLASTIAVFLLFYNMNSGILRGYAIFSIALGMLLYKWTISQYIVAVMSTIMKKTIYVVLKPFKLSVYAVCKVAKKPAKLLKTRLTVCIKVVTMTLCKHKKRGE